LESHFSNVPSFVISLTSKFNFSPKIKLDLPKRTKEAATQAACAGNARGYHSEYRNSWFNNRENDDA